MLRFSMIKFLLLSYLLLCFSLTQVHAADPTATEIATWVKDLNNDDFKTRQNAAVKLTEAGPTAIPALTEAAQSTELEVMSQALGILRKHFESTTPAVKEAAKAALEKIAAGNNSNAATRAKEIITPTSSAKSDPNINNQIPGQIIIGNGIQGRIQIMPAMPGGNIQIVPGGNVKAFSKSVSESNGVKTTKVKEDGTEIEIKETKDEILVKKTENGKTEEYKAKDAEELKKNHPAGHDLFEKHAQGNIMGGAIQVGAAIPAAKPAQERVLELQLRSIERQLESTQRLLESIAKQPNAKDALKSTAEKLKQAQDELQLAKSKLMEQPANDIKNDVKKNIDEKKSADAKSNDSDEQPDKAALRKELDEARQKTEQSKRDAEQAIRQELEAAKKAALDELKKAIGNGIPNQD